MNSNILMLIRVIYNCVHPSKIKFAYNSSHWKLALDRMCTSQLYINQFSHKFSQQTLHSSLKKINNIITVMYPPPFDITPCHYETPHCVINYLNSYHTWLSLRQWYLNGNLIIQQWSPYLIMLTIIKYVVYHASMTLVYGTCPLAK